MTKEQETAMYDQPDEEEFDWSTSHPNHIKAVEGEHDRLLVGYCAEHLRYEQIEPPLVPRKNPNRQGEKTLDWSDYDDLLGLVVRAYPSLTDHENRAPLVLTAYRMCAGPITRNDTAFQKRNRSPEGGIFGKTS